MTIMRDKILEEIILSRLLVTMSLAGKFGASYFTSLCLSFCPYLWNEDIKSNS